VIGTVIDGKYRINKLLGAGAMGQVYEAEHTATGRRVAVKVISSPDLIRDQTVIGRFQREARAAGGIDTQHITQVLDAGVDKESELPFLVMEYLTGEDLSALLKRLGPIAPDLALRIVAQACLGLQKAHEAGVIHRDIKPANLFLAKRDAGEIIVKVLDFGIAKVKMDQAQDTESAGLTKTGSMIGSPLYMSPEQARGDVKHIDHRADIWSMGIVLYQALTGQTPYQHITALGQLIIAICSEWPRHVQELAPWISSDVASIVHRCLRHNPEERYQSASEMFQAIRAQLPSGWSITEEMMLPLADTLRQQVASKLALTTQLAAAQTAVGSVGSAPVSQPGTTTTAAGSQVATVPPPAPAGGGTGKAAVGIGVAALLGVGGLGAYFATRTPAAPPPPPVTAISASVTMGPQAAPNPAPPSSAQVPSPTVVPVAVDTSPRRVKVVIMPADASIEIEGEKAVAKSGLLEITGTLGSVHRVRIFKGKNETITDVIVTEAGPSPPKIELTFGGPKPSATASAAPPKPGIIQKFE
jgi:serine/threonine-protein kinase